MNNWVSTRTVLEKISDYAGDTDGVLIELLINEDGFAQALGREIKEGRLEHKYGRVFITDLGNRFLRSRLNNELPERFSTWAEYFVDIHNHNDRIGDEEILRDRQYNDPSDFNNFVECSSKWWYIKSRVFDELNFFNRDECMMIVSILKQHSFNPHIDKICDKLNSLTLQRPNLETF